MTVLTKTSSRPVSVLPNAVLINSIFSSIGNLVSIDSFIGLSVSSVVEEDSVDACSNLSISFNGAGRDIVESCSAIISANTDNSDSEYGAVAHPAGSL